LDDQRNISGYVPIPPPTLKQNYQSNQQDNKQTGLLVGQMNISSAESRTIRRKQQMLYNQQLLQDINSNTKTNDNNYTEANTKNNTKINANNNNNNNNNTSIIENYNSNNAFNNNDIDNRLADYIRNLERENEEYRRRIISNNYPPALEPTNVTVSSYVDDRNKNRPTLQFKLPDNTTESNSNEERKLPSIKVTATDNDLTSKSSALKEAPKSPTKARMKLLTDVYGSSAFSSMSGMDLPTNPVSSSEASSSTTTATVYDPKSPPKSPTKARLMKYNEVYGKTQLFDEDVVDSVPVKSKKVSPTKARMRMMSDVYGVSNFNAADETIENKSITQPLRDVRHDAIILDQKTALAEQIAEKKRIKAEEKQRERLLDAEDERRVKRELIELNEFENNIKATKRAEAEEITKEMIAQQEKQFQKALARKGKTVFDDNNKNESSPNKNSFLKIKAPPKVSPSSRLPPNIVDVSPIKIKNDEAFDRSLSLPHLASHNQPQMFNPNPNPRQFAEDSDFNSIVDRFRPSSTDEVDSFLVNWQRQQYQSLATAHKFSAAPRQWPAFPPGTDNRGGIRDMAATGVIQFEVESRFISNDAGVMNDGLLQALGLPQVMAADSPSKELAGKSINIIAGQDINTITTIEDTNALVSDSSLLYGEYPNNDS